MHYHTLQCTIIPYNVLLYPTMHYRTLWVFHRESCLASLGSVLVETGLILYPHSAVKSASSSWWSYCLSLPNAGTTVRDPMLSSWVPCSWALWPKLSSQHIILAVSELILLLHIQERCICSTILWTMDNVVLKNCLLRLIPEQTISMRVLLPFSRKQWS